MGYFSNGTEGDFFQEEFCDRCVHDVNQDCPVWLLHLLWNYEQNNDGAKKEALDIFIPRNDRGENEECKMFIHRNEKLE